MTRAHLAIAVLTASTLLVGCVPVDDPGLDDDGRGDQARWWKFEDNGGGSYVGRGYAGEKMVAVATVLVSPEQVIVGLSAGSSSLGATWRRDGEAWALERQTINGPEAEHKLLTDSVLHLGYYVMGDGSWLENIEGCVRSRPEIASLLPVTCGELHKQVSVLTMASVAALLSMAVAIPLGAGVVGAYTGAGGTLAAAAPWLLASYHDLNVQCEYQPDELVIQYCE